MAFDYEAYLKRWGQEPAPDLKRQAATYPVEYGPSPDAPGFEPVAPLFVKDLDALDEEDELAEEPEEVRAYVKAVETLERSESAAAPATVALPATLANRAAELGAFGEMVEEQEQKVRRDFWVLDDDDEVILDQYPRRAEKNPMWIALLEGKRVFTEGMKPEQLAYLYPAARKRAARFAIPEFRIRMRQGTWRGIHGTVIWRDDLDPAEDDAED